MHITPTDLVQQLDGIATSDEFASRSGQLVDAWTRAGAGLEAVGPILRFMEDNPELAFGNPGSLVHFVERFHGKGYDALLLESIQRKPTAHTAWTLNRVINRTEDGAVRARLITLMRKAREHPLADDAAVESIAFSLEDL